MSRDALPPASIALANPTAPPGARPMTVAAMRAAVVAIRAGIFDDASDLSDIDLAGAVPASHSALAPPQRPDRPRLPWAGTNAGGPVVLAVAGHAGAGASTVAVAVAEGLVESRRVQLVDYAQPTRSGLAAASTIELGDDGTGWRRGRRDRLDVVRLARPFADGEFPPPPQTDADGLLVVDAGWPLTQALLDAPGSLLRVAIAVVVTRVTVPAVRQTEHVLAAVDGEPVIAAVGPARWPRAVVGSCGPRLLRLRSRGRVVRVPVDRRLEIAGLTGDRLPKPVAAAGRSLAAFLVPAGPPQSPTPHRGGAERSWTGSAEQRR